VISGTPASTTQGLSTFTVQATNASGSGAKAFSIIVNADNVTYQWYSNTVKSKIGGTLIPGATSSVFTPPSTNVNTRYYFCVVTNAHGKDTSEVSGAQITSGGTGCNSNIFNLGNVSFKSPTTWIITNGTIRQEWSDVVMATGCNKETFNAGSTDNFNADCRSNNLGYGDLFSWCAVARFHNILCPSPWRVPTSQDFIELDIALGGTGNTRTGATEFINATYLNPSVWGGVYGGGYSDGSLTNPPPSDPSVAYYWTSTEVPWSSAPGMERSYPSRMSIDRSGTVVPVTLIMSKGATAFTLRCVR
jgi:uncharacterized protein (TIGR02145 family)